MCTILPMSTLYRAQVTLWIQLIRSNSHDKSSTLLFFKTSTHMYNVNLYLFYSTDEYWRKSVKKINVPLTLVGFLFLPLEQMKVKSSSWFWGLQQHNQQRGKSFIILEYICGYNCKRNKFLYLLIFFLISIFLGHPLRGGR